MQSNFSLARCAAAAGLDDQRFCRKISKGGHAEYASRHQGGGVGEARGSAVGQTGRRKSCPLRAKQRERGYRRAEARSKRSRFITLFQDATKSRTNACSESLH